MTSTHTPKWKQFLSLGRRDGKVEKEVGSQEQHVSPSPASSLKRKRSEATLENGLPSNGTKTAIPPSPDIDATTASNTAKNAGSSSADKKATPAKAIVEPDLVDDKTVKQVREYLKTYKNDRDNWKFNKARQNTILKHWYNDRVFPSKDDSELLLNYLPSVQGGSRDRIIKDAKSVKKSRASSLSEHEEELKVLEDETAIKSAKKNVKMDKRMKKRATAVIKRMTS